MSKRIDPTTPIDVWLKFDSPDDEECAYEANTYRVARDEFRVDWYHTAVGLVSSREFNSYAEAREFLASNGFDDYSS